MQSETAYFFFLPMEKQNQNQSWLASNSDWLIAMFSSIVIDKNN